MTVGGNRLDGCPTATLPGLVGRDGGGGDSARACWFKAVVDLPLVGSLGGGASLSTFFSRLGGSGGNEAGSKTGALTRGWSPDDPVLAVPFVLAEAVLIFETDETADAVEAIESCEALRLGKSGRSEGLLGGNDGDSIAEPLVVVDEASDGCLGGKDGVSVGRRGGSPGIGDLEGSLLPALRGGAVGGAGLSVGRRAGRTGGGFT